jgi:multidrug transporter EmrE-like cation transporter
MWGWLFIFLSSFCSVLIVHFLKITEHKELNTIRVLTVNYFIATVTAYLISLRHTELPDYSGHSMLLPVLVSVVVGVIFIINFFIYSKSVYHNGVGISVAAMRISLIIPVLLSILFYLEMLELHQWMGILLVFLTLFLLLPDKRKMWQEPFSVSWLLVLLFILTGIGDASLKIYEAEFSGIMVKEHFMGLVFLSAFFTGGIFLAIKKDWKITKTEIMLGFLVGIPNLLASIFLIEALERMNGAVVYSSVNVLTVLGGTLLGICMWRDSFTIIQWIGLSLAVIAILMLI